MSWMPTSRWRCGTRACRRAPWSFEHAFLADAQTRARAVRLGVGVTVQHPLLYPLGGNLVRYWGPDRASQVMPVRAWVDEGALIAAGSDCNVSFFDPLLSIWGLVTRGTRTVGVQSPEHRVDTTRPSGLYTAAGGRLLREDRAKGWTVHVAKRLRADADTAKAAGADWAAVEAASLAVVDARGPETPPGAALITGACTATGRPVLAAHTGTWQSFADWTRTELVRRGEVHERAVLEWFRADGHDVADVSGAQDGAGATREALRGGAGVVYQGTLAGGGLGAALFGRPDFLSGPNRRLRRTGSCGRTGCTTRSWIPSWPGPRRPAPCCRPGSTRTCSPTCRDRAAVDAPGAR